MRYCYYLHDTEKNLRLREIKLLVLGFTAVAEAQRKARPWIPIAHAFYHSRMAGENLACCSFFPLSVCQIDLHNTTWILAYVVTS